MDSQELIKKLESKKEHYQSRYGFSEIFLFGSYAENNANADSDQLLIHLEIRSLYR
jgi:predicted nucleotidyltransferase